MSPDPSNFEPIPELQRTNADVTVLFLSASGVISTKEVNDLWYSSHNSVGVKTGEYGSLKVYYADYEASPLGCTSQYQVCIPDAAGRRYCTDLGGIGSLKIPEEQEDLFVSIINRSLTEVFGVVQNLGADTLTSKYTLNRGNQAPLPDDQWKRDVRNWIDIYLAAMQGMVRDAASGPASPEMLQFIAKPSTDISKYFCKNQVKNILRRFQVRFCD